MSNEEQEMIMVVPRSVLEGNEIVREKDAEHGQIRVVDQRVWEASLEAFEIHPRDDAEEDPDWKQPIPYMVIQDYAGNVLVYTRNGSEARLKGKGSIGFGGHVNEEEDAVLAQEHITKSLTREIEEELGYELKKDPVALGVINDDTNKVGQVHIGVLYLYQMNEEETDQFHRELKVSDEVAQISWVRPNKDVENFCDAHGAVLENWSKLSLPIISELTNKVVDERDENCNDRLRSENKAYPKTCKVCGLGPCKTKK